MPEAVGTLAFHALRLRGSYQLLIPMLFGDSGGCGVIDWHTASTQTSATKRLRDEGQKAEGCVASPTCGACASVRHWRSPRWAGNRNRDEDHHLHVRLPARPDAGSSPKQAQGAARVNHPTRIQGGDILFSLHPDRLAVATSPRRLRFEPVPCLEDPPHYRQANGQEEGGHAQAHADAHIGDPIETPAEAAD